MRGCSGEAVAFSLLRRFNGFITYEEVWILLATSWDGLVGGWVGVGVQGFLAAFTLRCSFTIESLAGEVPGRVTRPPDLPWLDIQAMVEAHFCLSLSRTGNRYCRILTDSVCLVLGYFHT